MRHLHKHLWKLPIPRYDPSNETHAKISRLGRAAAKSATGRISALKGQNEASELIGSKVRSELRRKWQKQDPACRAIEKAVEELLESGGLASSA